MTGLISITGVPSIASSPLTYTCVPSTFWIFARRHSKTIGSAFAALREYPRQRPITATTRVPCARFDPLWQYLVKYEDDLSVAEFAQPGKRVGPKTCRIKLDYDMILTPVVVDGIGPSTANATNRFDRKFHCFISAHGYPKTKAIFTLAVLPGKRH
jgi:hypothetical protein